jgi:CheY-like chemotaxis protein
VHVIGYTAHAMSSEQQQMRAAGFDDLLIKPITQGDLIKALNASRG